MNQQMGFWQAIGTSRKKILQYFIVAMLLFAVLPVFFSDELIMTIYALVFLSYGLFEFFLDIYQLLTRKINSVVFLYRIWYFFIIMLLLVTSYLLGGLATAFIR